MEKLKKRNCDHCGHTTIFTPEIGENIVVCPHCGDTFISWECPSVCPQDSCFNCPYNIGQVLEVYDMEDLRSMSEEEVSE